MALKGNEPCKGETTGFTLAACSIPHIAFIHWFAVLLAETTKLGLKIFLLVMFRLFADVVANRLHMDRTDAEFAVAALPGKVSIPRVERLQPAGGR